MAALVAAVLLSLNIFGTASFLYYVRGMTVLQSGSEVKLPVAKSTPETVPADPLVIAVRDEGTIWIDEEPVPFESLAAVVLEHSPERVLVRAEPTVRYPRMKAILQELGRAGVTNVTFSVTFTKEPPSTVY